MKGRPFLAVVLALALLATGLGLGAWALVLRRSPLALQHQALTLPRTALFVPRQAPLSLFLATDGEQLVDYARAVAPTRARREASEAVARLRDGAFAAAGLNYRDELASWLAPGLALALFDGGAPPTPEAAGVPAPTDAIASNDAIAPSGGWLLALSSRDGQGARRFLQRFWQTRSLAGTDLQVSRYRGMGLISGRGALVGSEPVPLATALVADDLVLIASGRGVLEQALDVSQIEELNLAGQPQLREGIERLGEGVGLLVARPAALEPWLGLSLPAAAEPRPGLLLAALRPRGRCLEVAGQLDLSAPLPLQAADDPRQRTLLAGLVGQPTSLALVQDPAGLLAQPLLAPLLRRAALPSETGPLPLRVAGGDGGPLLAALGGQGWLFGTPADQPSPAGLETALAAEGLIPAPLELPDRRALVWTRLSAAGGRQARRAGASPSGADQLQATLSGWRTAEGEQAWWGSSLALLEARPTGAVAAATLIQRLDDLDRPLAPLRWSLAAAPARQLLQSWRPWRWLTALAGGGMEPPVRGLALAVEADGAALRLQARLELG